MNEKKKDNTGLIQATYQIWMQKKPRAVYVGHFLTLECLNGKMQGEQQSVVNKLCSYPKLSIILYELPFNMFFLKDFGKFCLKRNPLKVSSALLYSDFRENDIIRLFKRWPWSSRYFILNNNLFNRRFFENYRVTWAINKVHVRYIRGEIFLNSFI